MRGGLLAEGDGFGLADVHDHAHLTRTIRAATGRTPSALRAALNRRDAF